jgi:hypothetical protein
VALIRYTPIIHHEIEGKIPMDDPLDFIDPDEIYDHGDPNNWKKVGTKKGSGALAHSRTAPPGTRKIYEIYEDVFGDRIEVHYFRHPDGTVSNVKVES